MTEPSVVILIPFRRWNPLVRRCVEGCLALAYDHYRICLLPDPDASIPPPWRDHPRILVLPSHHSGIAHKRNLGIRYHPEAAVFACIDSDAYPDRQWLKQGVQALEQAPCRWLVGGPELSPEGLEPRRQAVANALQSVLVSGPKAFAKRESASRYAVDLPTCNLLIRREAIQALGGFDETLEVGEDSALCQAVLRQGKRIYFCAQAQVYHYPRLLGGPFVKQRITSGYGILPLIRRCYRTMGAQAVAMELLPAAALIGLSLGWLAGLLSTSLLWVWLALVALYGALIAGEATRLSLKTGGWSGTAAALVIGNLGPGIGTLYRLVGGRLDISRFYCNYPVTGSNSIDRVQESAGGRAQPVDQ